jgi:putative endonuclease
MCNAPLRCDAHDGLFFFNTLILNNRLNVSWLTSIPALVKSLFFLWSSQFSKLCIIRLCPLSVYMLRCRNGALYTGISTDVPRRVESNIAGGDKAARLYSPICSGETRLCMMIGDEPGVEGGRHIKRLPKRKKK